jgi:hypothetical protein
MSHDECPQEPVIVELQKSQVMLGVKVDQVLENQRVLGETMTTALNRLTSIIEEDIGTRKDVEQGKKDIERLYLKARAADDSIAEITLRNAKCDGAGIFDNWLTVWNFIQQEKGWRRFAPAAMAFAAWIAVMYDKIMP